jgi:hypothetical protein
LFGGKGGIDSTASVHRLDIMTYSSRVFCISIINVGQVKISGSELDDEVVFDESVTPPSITDVLGGVGAAVAEATTGVANDEGCGTGESVDDDENVDVVDDGGVVAGDAVSDADDDDDDVAMTSLLLMASNFFSS